MIALAICFLVTQTALLCRSGQVFEVRIDPKAVHPLQVWNRGAKVAETLVTEYHPWSLQIADVDGDGVDEIAVGISEATYNIHFVHRTLFIMQFNGHRLVRKWTGSTMGRPLVDFCFGPKLPGRAQVLFTLERKLNNEIALSAHEWTGFGFRVVGSERTIHNAQRVQLVGTNLVLQDNLQSYKYPWKGLL